LTFDKINEAMERELAHMGKGRKAAKERIDNRSKGMPEAK